MTSHIRMTLVDHLVKNAALSNSGCLEWTGVLDRYGYGHIKIRVGSTRRDLIAHRAMYEYAVGAIPQGLVLDHLCCNRSCILPDHMEPVTVAENSRRAAAVRRIGRAA